MLAGVCSMKRSANLSDDVTEGRMRVRVEEEGVKREGWIMNS